MRNRLNYLIRGDRNLLRALFLSILTLNPILAVMYIFDLRIPPIGGVSLQDHIAILIGLGLVIAVWVLLEFTVLTYDSWIARLYRNAGALSFDIGLIILGVIALILAWEPGPVIVPLAFLGGLTFLAGVLSAIQVRSRFRMEDLHAAPSHRQNGNVPNDAQGTAQPEVYADIPTTDDEDPEAEETIAAGETQTTEVPIDPDNP